MESSGCKSRTAKANTQADGECCHSPGDWWVRSVHSKEAGHEDSAPKTRLAAMPTLLSPEPCYPYVFMSIDAATRRKKT